MNTIKINSVGYGNVNGLGYTEISLQRELRQFLPVCAELIDNINFNVDLIKANDIDKQKILFLNYLDINLIPLVFKQITYAKFFNQELTNQEINNNLKFLLVLAETNQNEILAKFLNTRFPNH